MGLPHTVARVCLVAERGRACFRFGHTGFGNKTSGYSGSDIETVYVQVALLYEQSDSIDDQTDAGARLRRHESSKQANLAAVPTVSKEMTSHIRGFAKQIGPAGWNTMQSSTIYQPRPSTIPRG